LHRIRLQKNMQLKIQIDLQMKSRKYYSASEAEKDVMKRCKMFFEPHGKNMQEACYINNIEKVENK